MTRYIPGKDLDAKFLEALVSERMKPFIIKNCPLMQRGGMKGNSSSEHLIVVKTWMKTNETKNSLNLQSIWYGKILWQGRIDWYLSIYVRLKNVVYTKQ